MPIGLAAIRACYGQDVDGPRGRELVAADTKPYVARRIASVEDAALATFGLPLYEMFIRGYVQKQWGSSPADLIAATLTDRFTIRYDDDSGYYGHARWQGLPERSYSHLFAKLLSHPRIDVVTGRVYERSSREFRFACVYTGPIDAFFEQRLGPLRRRSIHLRWNAETPPSGPSSAVVTHPGRDVLYYRTHRPCHLPWNAKSQHPAMYRLTGYENAGPAREGEPDAASISFVLRTAVNQSRAKQYLRLAQRVPHYFFAGRGTTFYQDMGATVRAALDLAAKLAHRYDLPNRGSR